TRVAGRTAHRSSSTAGSASTTSRGGRRRSEPSRDGRPGRRFDMTIAIGVDVGGSGIKVAAVDLDTGKLASTRQRVPTPQPSTPEAMLPIIAQLVKRATTSVKKPNAPVGVGMPCVVLDGTTIT